VDSHDELRELERAVFVSIRDKDRETLARILDDGFVYRVPGAADRDKAAFLETVAAVPGRILSVGSDDLAVSLVGDTGVLTGVQRAKVELADGSIIESAVAFVDVFVRRDDGWRLALAFGVELPAGRP
jgi:ketosteroid isomerase-like protein